MTERRDHESWKRIFCPRGLAIFGVSATNMTSFGTMFLQSNIASGFEGRIYPIGQKGGEVFGMSLYTSFEAVPDPVDLACVSVPAPAVPAILEECLKRGVAGAQILTAGFGETGTDEGAQLEREVASFSKRGLRIIGPNCFGIHCPTCGLTIMPGGGLPRIPGSVAFFGQSGGLAVDLGYAAPGMVFGWRRMVSYGNACDVDATEMLEVFADDPSCEIITGYVEGVRDGRRFFEALRNASREKPVILWKAGLTQSGSRAVMSHTGSMGGEGAIWKAAMKQAGAVVVNGQDELLDAVVAFLTLGEWTGKGIAIVGGGGALGVASADAADVHGFSLPAFSDATREKMQALMPPIGTSFNNPADVGTPMVALKTLASLMEYAAEDPNIDIVILIQIIHHITYITWKHLGNADIKLAQLSWHDEMAEICRSVREKTGKPVMQLLPPVSLDSEKLEVEDLVRKAREASHHAGVPSFPTIDRAIAAMRRVAEYWRWRRNQE